MPDGTEPALDPAAVALDHHLASLEQIWAEAEIPGSTGRIDRARHEIRHRTTGPIEERTRRATGHLGEAIRAVADRVERQSTWQREDHQLIGDLRAQLHQTAERADLLEETTRDQRHLLERLATQLAATQHALETMTSDVARLRARQDEIVTATQAAIAAAEPSTAGAAAGITPADVVPTPGTGRSLQELSEAGHDDLYRDLERAFRGSREAVKALTEIYLPDVRRSGGPVVDIGCGRGEWLELLSEHDIEAYGVDLNVAFAEENQQRGLDVRVGDAIAHLATIEPASLGAVTGFHLAEHLPLTVLLALADRAFTALRPGGVLILETPNPTNVRVGAAQFWIDPTHERPLHPEFLQFVLAHRGFAPVEIRPLHPARHFEQDWAALLDVDAPPGSPAAEVLDDLRNALAGPQDYAVLARVPDSV